MTQGTGGVYGILLAKPDLLITGYALTSRSIIVYPAFLSLWITQPKESLPAQRPFPFRERCPSSSSSPLPGEGSH